MNQAYTVSQRQLALIGLRRYFETVPKDLLPQFLMACKDLGKNLASSGEILLLKFAVFLLTGLIISDGGSFFPDFPDFFLSLFSSRDTIDCVLDAIFDLTNSDFQIPISLINPLPDLLAASSDAQILKIVRNLSRHNTHTDFVAHHILPLILTQHQNYEPGAMAEAMCIIASFWAQTGDTGLCQFLIYCLRTQDQSLLSEMLDVLQDSTFLPYDRDFVAILFDCWESPASPAYDFVSQTQNLAQKLVEFHGSAAVLEVFEPAIRSCANPGQILRGLCCVVAMVPIDDPSRFIPFAQSHLHDEHRVDAILCLTYLCSNDPELRSYAVTNIISFLSDPDPAVRDVTLWALEEIFPEEGIPMDLKWWDHFLAAYQRTVGESGADSLRLGHLMSWYIECVDFRGDSRFEAFYDTLLSNMMALDANMFDAELISVLQPVIRPVYTEEVRKMLVRVEEFLRRTDSQHMIMNCCRLLRCFVEVYGNDVFVDDCLRRNLELVTEGVVRGNSGFNLSIKSFFELVQAVFERLELYESEIGMIWEGFGLENFKGEDFDTMSSIGGAFLGFVKKMSDGVRERFASVARED
jgi:hypothetical protein